MATPLNLTTGVVYLAGTITLTAVTVSGTSTFGVINASGVETISTSFQDLTSGLGQLTLNSTTAFAINKGASFALGGAYTGTTPTTFAGLLGAKENVTDGNVAGYLAFYTRAAASTPAEVARFSSTGLLSLNSKIGTYNSVTTAGWGVPAIQAAARVVAATNTGTASIATYTVGAADGSFRISANCLVTTSTTHSFSLDCTYTDESNAARTFTLPVAQLAGSFITSGLITNVTGAGPYESAVAHIRCKASTVITIRTSAGGTFTNVVYNAEGNIQQIS